MKNRRPDLFVKSKAEIYERPPAQDYHLYLPRIAPLADYLEIDVRDLCKPAGRMVGSPGHDRAKNFLIRRLKSLGCLPYLGDTFSLGYKKNRKSFENLIGVLPGTNRDLPPILIGAHYDSVIAGHCADDNGAAVAICLALAAIFQKGGPLERDLVVALFDAEEPPYFNTASMGSIRFYLDQADKRGFHFAMIFDLVGHDISVPVSWIPGIGGPLSRLPGMGDGDFSIPWFKDALFMTGAESHPDIGPVIREVNVPSSIRLMPVSNHYIGDMSDHGIFRENGVPYVFFSCAQWAHYHSPTDTPDRLNYQKMARITHLAARLLIYFDAENFPGKGGADTLELELEGLRKSAGVLYPLLLRILGVKEIRTRKQLDKVVESLLSAGLL